MSPDAQHYIPRFYLKQFSRKIRAAYRIACFDKSIGKEFTTNIVNVAQETDFYGGQEVEQQEAESAESFFARREEAWSIALSSVASDPALIRSTEVRLPLLEFVASFMARTPEYRKVIKSILAKARSELPDMAIPEFSKEEVKRLQSRSIVDNIPRYQSILQMMDFYIFTNLTNHPLWISDQPLVRHNESSDPYRGNLGLLSKGIELYLPLSPTLLLGLTEPGLVKTHRFEFEIGPEHVEFSNGRQIWFSVRYVYSPKQHFGLAKEILANHPELANPDRPRIV